MKQNERPDERRDSHTLRLIDRKRREMVTPGAAKAKGRRLQNWVREKILAKITGLRAGDVVSTPMGVNGSDVQLSPHALDILPLQFECKNNKRNSIYAIYDQAVSHGNNIPVAVVKADFKTPLAVVAFEHYLDLWAEIQQLKQSQRVTKK